MLILSDEEHFNIILSAIRDYIPGQNDIPILIVQKLSKYIIDTVKTPFTTQDIYDEVEECFIFYNDFVKEKQINFDLIDDSFFELVKEYLNIIVGEYNENMGEN